MSDTGGKALKNLPDWLSSGKWIGMKDRYGQIQVAEKAITFNRPEWLPREWYMAIIRTVDYGMEKPNADPQIGEESSTVPDASQKSKTPELLPDGWTMELKTHGRSKREGKTSKLTKSKKYKTLQPLPGQPSKRRCGFEPSRSTRAAAHRMPKQLEAESVGETSGATEEEECRQTK